MTKAVWAILVLLMVFFVDLPDSHAAETGKTADKKKAVSNRKAVSAKNRSDPAVKSRPQSRQQTLAKPTRAKRRDAVVQSARATRKTAGKRIAAAPMQERLVKRVVTIHGKRKVVMERVKLAAPAAVPLDTFNPATDTLSLNSNVVYAVDGTTSEVLFEKNASVPMPIASITKIMTALVVLDAKQDMNEVIEVTENDVDRERHSASRLPVGARLSRADLLHIALMSSENRAASALGRNYPGGLPAFVAAMNAKARALGMTNTVYVEPTGLSSQNVSSARDLARLVDAATRHPVLAQYSVNEEYSVDTGKRTVHYVNSNRLVRNSDWDIELQKTGYITEAGRCLVMQVKLAGRKVVMVILNSPGSYERFAEANRLLKWVSQKIHRPAEVKMVSSPG